MSAHAMLLETLRTRFGDRGLRAGTPPDPTAVFPAAHPEIGDVRVWGTWNRASTVGEVIGATVEIGENLLHYDFDNFDTHLELRERGERVTRDVVRFLEELFADRLLFWISDDEARKPGWRERGAAGHVDPMVTDDRVYRRFLWSGPLPLWQATPAILARGRIRDEREQMVMHLRLHTEGPGGFNSTERELALRLLAEYERRAS